VIRPIRLPGVIERRRRRSRIRAAGRASAEAAQAAAEAEALRRLILRDHLAVERTRLANERTVLSYVRTAFAFLAGALTLLHLYQTPAALMSAIALGIVGAVLVGVGAWRYKTVGLRVHAYALRGDPPEEPRASAPTDLPSPLSPPAP